MLANQNMHRQVAAGRLPPQAGRPDGRQPMCDWLELVPELAAVVAEHPAYEQLSEFHFRRDLLPVVLRGVHQTVARLQAWASAAMLDQPLLHTLQ